MYHGISAADFLSGARRSLPDVVAPLTEFKGADVFQGKDDAMFLHDRP